MDKRTFIKTSTLLVGGAMLTRMTSCATEKKEPLQNWAGNLTYSTGNVHYPKSLEEVQEIVKRCKHLTALGSRHSFSTIADNSENQISTRDLNKLVQIDKDAGTVTVEAGMKYGELCKTLDDNGFALHNLASLPHISIAGACATATHGSGVGNGNLATAVSAIEFVNAFGEVIRLSRKDGEVFNGAVVGLGALGVVTKITLDLQPRFDMRQVVYQNLSMDALEKNFLEIMSSGYSVSLFTTWANRNVNEVWIKSKVEQGSDIFQIAPDFFGAKAAGKNLHPVEDQPAENCTEQMGVAGPWYERLAHFKMGFTPSAGKELQAEYFVPLENGYEAMMAVEKLHEKITPHLFISEIRTVAADELWMSPCYRKPCVAIHTTWKQDWDTVIKLIPMVEQQLAPFNPLPHMAKLSTLSPEVLQGRIQKLNDFKALVREHDPEGKFRNAFLSENLFG